MNSIPRSLSMLALCAGLLWTAGSPAAWAKESTGTTENSAQPEVLGGLDVAQRQQRLEARRLAGHWTRALASRYYDIYSNGPEAEVAQYGKMMDLMVREYRRIFVHDAPLPDYLNIELYRNQAEFMEREQRPEGVLGFYDGRRMVAFHGGRAAGGTAATLFHEGTHQFQDLVIPGMLELKNARIWVIEGLAVYFEASSFVKQGGKFRLVTGEIPRERLQQLKCALRARQTASLSELIRMPRERFDALHYAQAWSLIHFFCHAYGGKNQKYFVKYFNELREGDADPLASFERIFHKPMPVIEQAWREYVLSL